MPFGIKKSDGKFQVINKHTGRVLGTHDSSDQANKQLAAVHINYYGESEVIDETKGKVFKIDIRKLWSPNWKIKETIQDIKASRISQTKEPITVARMGKGKFFIINGNHRVIEAIMRGEKEIDAVLDEYVPDMNKTGGAYDSMTKDAEPVAQEVKTSEPQVVDELSNALEPDQTTYDDTTKYHGKVPEIKFIDPKIVKRLNSNEVNTVSDEVASTMDFSEPIDVYIFRDGEIICQNGHHRLAAAKQRGMSLINVNITAINAYGKMINDLIQKQQIHEATSIKELYECMCESYGIRTDKSGFSAKETEPATQSDTKKVKEILNNKNLPDVAEDGKAYVVVWADGRGIFACKNKKYLSKWLTDTGSWAEIVSIKYTEPVHKNKKLKVIKENTENDPYGAGPCPICGEFATGTFRHIGAPKICKNGHYFGGTCGHPDCANTPIPSVVDELSNAGDIQDEPSWNNTEYDQNIIKKKPIFVFDHNFKDLGPAKVGIFKETGKYFFINIDNKEKIGDIEFKKVDILVGGKVLRGIESDYKVSIVGNYRGKGFSYIMYDNIIRHNNNNPGMWVSDTKLTPVNRSVWKNLLKKYPHEFLISNGHTSPLWISINDKQNIEKYRLQFHVQKIKDNPESIWDEKWNAERIRILLKSN